ncbi:MAG: NAD(P)/FAD-dependent oxidoreductase [Bacteroidota bacterium]
MKIAIIGFGAAAIGFIERMMGAGHELHVYEKSPDIFASGISGVRADGKLFVSAEMGGDMFIEPALQKQLVDFYISRTGNGFYETGRSFHESGYYKQFYDKGFQPVAADFYHLGTDQLQMVLQNIYNYFIEDGNVKFHFNSNVERVEIDGEGVILDGKDRFDKAVVCVGRSGHKLIKSTIARYPDLVLENTKLDFGIRFELPNHIVEDLNREMYEFKVRYRSRTGYMVRTFCNNPSGFVVVENYGDFVTVNGHANSKEKSKNTNFAVLTTVELTQPFNDPIGYGSHIAKLTNILAGQDKLILQTYRDFRNSKRTKRMYRVLPTLDSSKYIMGDINLAYPRRIIESIIDFLDNLNTVVPGITNDDNLVYAPEIKFYSNKLSNSLFNHIKFAGDCSGYTRSFIYATAHGYMVADEML